MDLKSIKEINDLAYIIKQSVSKKDVDESFLILAAIITLIEQIKNIGNIEKSVYGLTRLIDDVRHQLYEDSSQHKWNYQSMYDQLLSMEDREKKLRKLMEESSHLTTNGVLKNDKLAKNK